MNELKSEEEKEGSPFDHLTDHNFFQVLISIQKKRKIVALLLLIPHTYVKGKNLTIRKSSSLLN